MLNPPIENNLKNEAMKKNEKCIFKTISSASEENIRRKITEKIFFNKILINTTSERFKQNKKAELFCKEQIEQKNKSERKIKIKDSFLYEFISANKDCILLQRKRFREVKYFLCFSFF
jgi:hypothetical protein